MLKHWRNRAAALGLSLCLVGALCPVARAAGPEVSAQSAVVLTADTGTVLFEKDGHTPRPVASTTKIMTALLALEAAQERGDPLVDITQEMVAVEGSSMGLQAGDSISLTGLAAGMLLASGNDAANAAALYLDGSLESFAARMNQRAAALGMEDTHFVNCTGLDDEPSAAEHLTSAYDIALMSRELITKYPKILEYSSIWMENITHVTRQGSKEFGLTNTNKLLRSYDGCVGLKTGSTSLAKYCVSAVASRNNITLISVVMAAPDYKVRFKDAAAMLNYGFSKCSLFTDENPEKLPQIEVRKGTKPTAEVKYEKNFQYLSTDGKPIGEVERKLNLETQVQAPVKKGETAGTLEYYRDGQKLGEINILFTETIEKATYKNCLEKIITEAF